jgi:hypothetical protein
MKLADFSNEHILWEGDNQLSPLRLCATITEGLATLRVTQRPEKGGIIKGLGNFAKAHPFLTGMVAGFAVDALSTYFKNKNYTTKFYAKDITERSFYRKMVEQLMKTGHYKIKKQGYENGSGYTWELQRIR